MFYGVNFHIMWGSLVECSTLFILVRILLFLELQIWYYLILSQRMDDAAIFAKSSNEIVRKQLQQRNS
jgi:hypothetical protein